MRSERRKLWIGGAVVGALALATLSAVYFANLPTAESALAGPNVCSYYADATYKKVGGAQGTGCCGTVINWGIVTPYKKCQKIYCLDVLCPN